MKEKIKYWWYENGFIVKMILGFMLVIVGLILLVMFFFRMNCIKLGENTNWITKWAFWGGGNDGCLVLTKDGWTPYETLRIVKKLQ